MSSSYMSVEKNHTVARREIIPYLLCFCLCSVLLFNAMMLPHLYFTNSRKFLDNIARHAKEGIIMSWAVPGQGG